MKNNEHTVLYNSEVNVWVKILGSISGPYKTTTFAADGTQTISSWERVLKADQPLAEVIKYFTKSAVACGRNKTFRSLYNCSLQQTFSSVCIVTKPRARESVNWISISRKAKRVFSSTQLRDRLWLLPSNLVDGYRESTFRESLPLAERHGAIHLHAWKPKFRMPGNVPPLHLPSSGHGTYEAQEEL